jgi:flavodoxin I
MSRSPSEFDTVILGTYTWGDGKIPKEVKDWLVKNKNIIEGKRFFLFGSGNSIYTHYCRAVDSCEKIIVDCGGDVVSKIKFEQRFKEDEQDKSELNTFIKKLSHNI